MATRSVRREPALGRAEGTPWSPVKRLRLGGFQPYVGDAASFKPLNPAQLARTPWAGNNRTGKCQYFQGNLAETGGFEPPIRLYSV
jgi:hypothetical protein